MRRLLPKLLAALAVVFALIQVVPYRPTHPPVTQAPAWDRPETQALAERACMDCHSNQGSTPWYGYVAPVAWVVRHHVDEGRSKLNLSELDQPQRDAHEAGEAVLEGEMPPAYYTLMHPDARLTDQERKTLAAGLDATLAGVPRAKGGEGGAEEEHGEEEELGEDDD
ncbi:MAG: heme-binding domain-containing protein [Alphaproteobacteria bacterium]|nr:heme-binding domain-containing protein [Alphaproteobacteria bacterium]